MPPARDAATQAALDRLLRENRLSPERKLFREAMRDALTPTGTPGVYGLAANPHPSESVVDIYGAGHVVQAEQVGAGLAFAEAARPDWQETMEMRALKAGRPSDKVEVEVRLGDILSQGGLLYPVESVTVERAWYCTLPLNAVEVREAV